MFSPSRSRSPRSKRTPQKSVSFRLYELEQKTKLKASYPFLSADQIKSRIKDQWHNLAQEEKNKYTKVRLKPTPVKDKQRSNKYEKSLDYTRKRKTNSAVTAIKKQKLEVCPTPEFVNMEKLHDFRTIHTEAYDNDFSDFPASQENQTEATRCDWMKTGMVMYEKAGFNVVRRTPEVIDNNPSQQTGILKTREKTEQPAITKGHVSFSSPTDVYQLSDVYSDNFSDNDNDGLLIKRNEYNASPLLTEPGIEYSDDSDDDDDAVLITRQEEDCETTDMATAEQDQVLDQDRNDIKESEVNPDETNQKQSRENQDESSQMLDKPKPTVTKRKLTGANPGNQREKSPKRKLAKKSDNIDVDEQAYQEKDQLEVEKDLVADDLKVAFIDERSDNNSEQFKSPLPDTGKTRLRRGRKRKQEDARSAAITTPIGSASKLSQLVTPTGAQHVDTNNYTTPQMDEDLQHKTLEAAVKAPQKRRQSAPSTTDLEKLRVLTAGRRVTRSLIAAKEVVEKMSPELSHTPCDDKAQVAERRRNEVQNNLHQLENSCNLMDPSGDARSSNVNKQGKSYHPTENKDVSMGIDASDGDKLAGVLATDKNFGTKSDTSKSSPSPLKVDTNFIASVTTSETRNPYLKYEDMFCHHAMGNQNNGSFRCMSEESSGASQNSEASSASPITALTVNTNPVLEKALRNLRCTSDSPKICCETTSTRSSPGILSPALSGVSELSSASSSSVLMDQNTDQGDSICQTESQVKNTQQSLCQMFKDLTPPDKKTAGPYKTQRLVSSSAKDSKNFKQLFQSEEESLFF